MNPADLTAGTSYADAEGNARRIDRIEQAHAKGPGIVQYTVLACAEWPKHVGKNYICCPRYFAGLAVNALVTTDL